MTYGAPWKKTKFIAPQVFFARKNPIELKMVLFSLFFTVEMWWNQTWLGQMAIRIIMVHLHGIVQEVIRLIPDRSVLHLL